MLMREFKYIREETEKKAKKEIWITRTGKILRLDVDEYFKTHDDIPISIHYEIAKLEFPDNPYPEDVFFNLRYIKLGGITGNRCKKMPNTRQMETLIELGIRAISVQDENIILNVQ
jgi:hypothetical protein